MYFIVFLYGIVWVLNINKYNSDFNCNESKYCILELKIEFWHKKPFSICFVHKSRKFSNFEPTVDYIMLRNFGTVRPIFPKIAPKVAQDLKEKKSWKLVARKKISTKLSRETSRGGGIRPPPPPPALLGLNGLSKSAQAFTVGFLKLLSIHPIHIVVWENFPFKLAWSVIKIFILISKFALVWKPSEFIRINMKFIPGWEANPSHPLRRGRCHYPGLPDPSGIPAPRVPFSLL